MAKGKVLVIGGAGFIGSLVNKLLNDSGYETVVLDNLSRGNLKAVVKGEFVQGDMGDKKLLDKLFTEHKFDAVFHFAALIAVGESVTNPALYYHNNVVNTLTLLDSMVKHKVPNFIFSSSAAIYGIPESNPINEDAPKKPINPYGETKWIVENILRDYSHAYNLKYCALRYFNAAGGDPNGQVKNYQTQQTNLIPVVLRHLLDPSEDITINGTDYPTPDGTCVRDYIHLYDLATAHLLGMEYLIKGGPSVSLNLGNGSGYSVSEVINAAEKVTGKKVKAVKGPRRAGDPPALTANSAKARSVLGWNPQYPQLEKIIEHAWLAYKV